jgi:leucyl aminopeptidase
VVGVLNAKAQAPHLFEHTYPEVVQEDARIRSLMNQVSVDSLTATIDHLQSYHTRRWDSRMVYDVQDWLYDTYREMGLDTVLLHDFPVVLHDTLYETSDNVIAIQRGLVYPDEYVVCGAHYDSYNNSPGHPDSLRAPGADDNASGSSGILETARLLSQCKFERSILYCGWAAEEIGLIGSAAFAKDCADHMLDIVGYFNLDMIGYLKEGSDIHVHLMYTTQDSTIANYVYDFSHVYFPEMPIRQNWLSWGDSDYSSFNRNGYAAVHPFEDVYQSSPFIHTPNDILGVSVNNMAQVKRFTELNLGLVATLAGFVDTSVEESDTEPLVIYPNPVSESLFVKGNGIQQIEVYNLMGQKIITQSYANVDEGRIEVGVLVPSVYFVRVIGFDGKVFVQKFVKK